MEARSTHTHTHTHTPPYGQSMHVRIEIYINIVIKKLINKPSFVTTIYIYNALLFRKQKARDIYVYHVFTIPRENIKRHVT